MVFCHDRPWVVETPGITWAAGAALRGEEAMETAAWHARRLADALIPTRPGLVFHGHLHIRYTALWKYPGGAARVEGLDCDGVADPADNVIIDVRRLVCRRPGWSSEVSGAVRRLPQSESSIQGRGRLC